MPDLKQRVVWSLDRSCMLREESSSKRPRDVERCLESILVYERALREGGDGGELLGDILITSTRSMSDPFQLGGMRKMGWPEKGWSVSKRFQRQGGAKGLFGCCGGCPVNVTRHRLGGCVGSLYVDPDAIWLNDELAALIGKLNMAATYGERFHVTQPLWYGLWRAKTLDAEAQSVLLDLMTGLLEWDESEDAGGLGQELRSGIIGLVSAMRAARSQGLSLRVELLPPGRCMLDLETIFPHCPACRAGACDHVWQRPYPTALQACSVCGTRFSPAETAASYRVPREGESLYDLLGREGYQQLLAQYLQARGCSSAEVNALIEEALRTLVEERNFESRLDQLRERQREFLQQNIFFGLPTASPPPSEVVEPPESTETGGLGEQVWYDAKNFEVVLHRVVSLGVAVRYMTHSGGDQSHERHVWDQIDDPLAILKSWVDEGCCSKFSALLIVPSSMMGMDEGERG